MNFASYTTSIENRTMKRVLIVFVLLNSFLNLQAEETLSFAESDKMGELKDRVLDRKLQLNLVRQLIKTEDLDTQYPKLQFIFKNEMSNRYLLQSLEFFVNESKVYSFFSDPKEKDKKSTQAHEVNLPPGKHEIRVVAIYNGNDTGVFSYLSDYKIRAEGKREIEVIKGRDQVLKIKGFEKGGVLTDFKERPAIEIMVNR
ncbi:MAG: hypothetical protein VX642_14515 [Bdellovibrionota bacterium]|nr:hypothetical protein [Bdellovibrionota bacterium]